MKSRVVASTVMAGLIAASMTACAFITPQQTTRTYTPSDGVNGSAGGVEIRNMLVIASADGQTASLVGALVNTTDSTKDVTVQYATSSGTETKQIEVPTGLLSLRTEDSTASASTSTASSGTGQTQQVVLENVDATLGGLFPVSFLNGSDSASLQLPVLTGDFSEYSTLVPTPSPTPTKTKKPKPTDSPSFGESLAPSESPTPTDTASAG